MGRYHLSLTAVARRAPQPVTRRQPLGVGELPAQAMTSLPIVSVVIVRQHSRHQWQACLSSLIALDYPREKLELILVESDEEAEATAAVQADFPWVLKVQRPEHAGLAAGNNLGAGKASGNYVLFLASN